MHTGEVPRAAQVFVGLIALLFAIPSLAMVAYSIWLLLHRQSGEPATTPLIVAGIFSILGIPLFMVGIRLVAGWRQRGGGLFPPLGLRITGAVILVLPLVPLLNGNAFDTVAALLHAGTGLGLFAIARRRENALSDPASASHVILPPPPPPRA
ncbi:MAG TPA: hypothetical protein VN605_11175 [Thermoanaerobaculia bacterium]|nr:hypothetical protein [Thermoanaerobaculia bacterium]